MPGDWATEPLGASFERHFPGEWGDNPDKKAPNACVLRSTNLDEEAHVDLATGAPRLISASKIAERGLLDGDILLEASGGGPGKPVGRVALFKDDGNGPYLCSNFFRALRPKSTRDPGFLTWRLHWLHRQPKIWVFQQQTTGIINLKYRDYFAHEIEVPPLPEQRRIAEILDTLDEAIRKTEQVIKKLQQMKQGLLHDLLTRGINEHGELRDPQRHPEQFKDSPLGRIPKEWEVASLGSRLSFITDYRGYTPPYIDEGIAVISAENVGDGEIKSTTKWISEKTYRETTTRGFSEAGDTLFTTEAPVAAVARIPDDQIYRLTRRVIALRPDERMTKAFLFWLVHWNKLRGAWVGKTHGSTVPRILKPDILGLLVGVPPLREQVVAAATLDELEARRNGARAELSKLRTLKQGLMDDLLTGRVRVNVEEATA